MFCIALQPLLSSEQSALQQLDEIQNGFAQVMQEEMEKMFAAKLGLSTFNTALFNELVTLMMQTSVDYTVFFRELSSIPDDISLLKKSFYKNLNEEMEKRWSAWLTKWTSLITATSCTPEDISTQMKGVNPKYILREWILAPAYQQAASGNYALIRELQEVMTQPYTEQSKEVDEKYYRLKPPEFSEVGGVSHLSCSS